MDAIMYLPDFLWDGASGSAREEMAVVVENKRVSFVGTKGEAEKQYGEAKRCLLKNRLVLPSFIDAHDHGRGISPVGYSVSDRCLELWLSDLWKIPAVPHYAATYYDGLKLVSSGVSTVVHSHNPNNWSALEEELIDSAGGYLDAGLRCVLCPLYIDQNKVVYDDRENFLNSLPPHLKQIYASGINDKIYTLDAYFQLIERLRKRLSKQIGEGMVQIQLHPNGGQWCSDEALLQMKEYALKNHMRIHMHLLETKYQYLYAKRKWGCTFIRHYEDIGFLGPWVSFAHSVWLEDEDMDLLAKSKAMVVTNPSSNIRLKSGIIRLHSLIKAGVVTGLGLDGCALDDDQDYLREMRLAWFNMEETGVDGGIDTMVPLIMGTLNGGEITGGQLSPGAIKKGLPADLVCINVNKLRHPYADEQVNILELLLQRGTRKVVEEVFVNGKIVYSAAGEAIKRKQKEAEQALTHAIMKLRQGHKPSSEREGMFQELYKFYKKWEEEL